MPPGCHTTKTELIMLHLRKRLAIRVPDRLAIVAAVTLTITAAGGVMGDAWLDRGASGDAVEVQRVPVSAEQADPTSDDAGRRSGLTLRLLLFRHG